MYSYKINNSYTVYVNFAYINSCIKASRKTAKSKSTRHTGSYGERISVKDIISIGSVVRVRNLDTQKVQTFFLSESNTFHSEIRTISDLSPVGKALMHHCVGETVCAHTPSGNVKYQILSINK